MTSPSTDALVIAGTIFTTLYVLALIGYFAFRQYIKLKEMEIRARGGMDPLRMHLESELNDTNQRHLSTINQWQDANHLILASQKNSTDPRKSHKAPESDEFLSMHGISGSDFIVDEKLVFVLTPFLPEFDQTFRSIKRICNDVGLNCIKGDEEHIPGEVFPHILRQIVKARLVIANISGRNPNVYYELGIAHALSKPVILLAKHSDDLPFDVKSKYVVLYKDTKDLHARLKTVLTRIFISS